MCMIPACALDMNQLGRGYFCIQALEGLMTNKANTSKGVPSSQFKMRLNADVIQL